MQRVSSKRCFLSQDIEYERAFSPNASLQSFPSVADGGW